MLSWEPVSDAAADELAAVALVLVELADALEALATLEALADAEPPEDEQPANSALPANAAPTTPVNLSISRLV